MEYSSEEIRKKIQSLNTLGQIGGKGTVRRKKKKVNKIKTTIKKSQDDIHLENCIRRINKEVSLIDDKDNLELFNVWLEDTIYFYLDGISKEEVPNIEYLEMIYDDPVEFYYQHFIKKKENIIELIGSVEKFHEIFHKEYIPYIVDLYKDIENILINKKYLETENDNTKDSEILTAKECYEQLELNSTEEYTEKEIKTAYRKKALILHPDKHPNEEELYQDKFKKLNKAYKTILKEYISTINK